MNYSLFMTWKPILNFQILRILEFFLPSLGAMGITGLGCCCRFPGSFAFPLLFPIPVCAAFKRGLTCKSKIHPHPWKGDAIWPMTVNTVGFRRTGAGKGYLWALKQAQVYVLRKLYVPISSIY